MGDETKSESTNERHDTQQEGGLAAVGGGNIPQSGAPLGHGAAPKDGEDAKNADPNATDQSSNLGNVNASDMPAQGTLGGRNPGQAGKSIGDRDRPREHSNIENGPVDPMTSRAPGKVNEHTEEDPEKEP